MKKKAAEQQLLPETSSESSHAVGEEKQSPSATPPSSKSELPDTFALLIGGTGIYASFLYVGSLQEDVFMYVAEDGSMFDQAWFLQVCESLAALLVGFVGVVAVSGLTVGLPLRMFCWSGAGQVSAKACSNLALAAGLSYPCMILAKSAKMFPVMVGSLVMGGASYGMREYLQVVAIMGGTILVIFSRQLSPRSIVLGDGRSSLVAVIYIGLSLVFDGTVAGFQKRLLSDTAEVGIRLKPPDFLFWTSVPMTFISGAIAVAQGDFQTGLEFCLENPALQGKILRFSFASAVGQVFVFYTLAHFDPLVVSAITTTRKIFSILLSIFLKGHSLSPLGWAGVALASMGIVSEFDAKRQKHISLMDKKKSGSSWVLDGSPTKRTQTTPEETP